MVVIIDSPTSDGESLRATLWNLLWKLLGEEIMEALIGKARVQMAWQSQVIYDSPKWTILITRFMASIGFMRVKRSAPQATPEFRCFPSAATTGQF